MSYIEKNRWYMTASKLKCFIKNPEEYKLQYIDEIEIEKSEEKKRHFVIWSAFDDLVSFGEDYFLEKYYIDQWLVTDELKQELINKWHDPKEIKAMKLPELRALFYQEDVKIRLTPAEWRDIMGMYSEVKRQPCFDFWNKNYQTQKEIIAEYNWIKLKGTLDRIDIENKTIRDRKTSWRIDNFEYDMENTFDYVLSMAFYYVLARVSLWIDCDVFLDVVGKSYPYPSVSYKLTKDKLLQKVKDTIKPALEFYSHCLQTDTRPSVHWVHKTPISRYDTMKSDYYPYMKSSIAQESVLPYEY